MGEPGTKEVLRLEDLEAAGNIHTGRKHVLSVLVENKPGVLTRVAGLFARRGFNIGTLAVGRDLEQRHLAGNRLLGLEIADLDHVDELVELLRDLVDRVGRPVEHDRHAGHRLVLRRPHGERVDVEAASREQARDPREDPGLVLDQHRQHVLAAGMDVAGGLEVLEPQDLFCPRLAHQPTMSLAAAPAGIIG